MRNEFTDGSIIKMDRTRRMRVTGSAVDVGVGARAAWFVGGVPKPKGNFSIYRWNGRGWVTVKGAAHRIAVSPEGVPWVINSAGKIFRRSGDVWEGLPGTANDIGVGADGQAWVIGNRRRAGGNLSIHRWNGSSWELVKGGGIRIAVSPEGVPWVVDTTGRIHRRSGSTWEILPGSAVDIGVGANDTAWKIGRLPQPRNNFSIHRWNGSSWRAVAGSAVRVAVSPGGVPWVVNSSNLELEAIVKAIRSRKPLSSDKVLAAHIAYLHPFSSTNDFVLKQLLDDPICQVPAKPAIVLPVMHRLLRAILGENFPQDLAVELERELEKPNDSRELGAFLKRMQRFDEVGETA